MLSESVRPFSTKKKEDELCQVSTKRKSTDNIIHWQILKTERNCQKWQLLKTGEMLSTVDLTLVATRFDLSM